MGIISYIKSIFSKPQQGTIYIKPSESKQVSAKKGTVPAGFNVQRTTSGGIVTTPSGYLSGISSGGGGASGGGSVADTSVGVRGGGGTITQAQMSKQIDLKDLTPTPRTTQALFDIKKSGDLTPIQKFEASKDISASMQLKQKLFQDKQKESYDARTGMFISPSPTGYGSTGYMRPPTPSEKIKIEKAMEKGGGDLPLRETITGVGTSLFSLGTMQLTQPLTEEEVGELYDPDSFIKTLGQVASPYQHFKVFKSRKDYEKAVDVVDKDIVKLESANKQYEGVESKFVDKWKSNIFTYGDGRQEFIGTEDQYNKYSKDYDNLNKEYNKVDSRFNYVTSTPTYKKVIADSEGRKTIFERIDKSKLSPTKKRAFTFAVSGIEFLSFVNPVQRVLYGTESLASGTGAILSKEDLTTKQKIKAGIDVGIGTVLLKSGFRGGGTVLGKAGEGEGVLGTVAKWEKKLGIELYGREGGLARAGLEFAETRGGKVLKTSALPVGLGTVSGVDIYKQTEDLGMAVAGGLGVVAGIGLPMAYEKIRTGTTLTKLERQELKKNLDKLEKSDLKFFEPIIKGRGSRPNSDLVIFTGVQGKGKFARTIEVTGDLVRGAKGLTFFPKGEGTSKTVGTIKIKGQAEKGFTDIQKFDTKQITKGIVLGEIKGYQIGTTASISLYIPKGQISALWKIPKGKGIVIDVKLAKERAKQFLSRKNIQRGGKKELEIEAFSRLIVEKKISPEEPSYSKKPKEYEVTEESVSLGKFLGEKPLESIGISKAKGELGVVMKVGKPLDIDSYIIKKVAGAKKTPLSKTFGEPPTTPLKSAPPKTTRPVQEQVQIKREIPKEVLEPKIGKEIIEQVSKKIKRKTREAVERLGTIKTEIPKSIYGGITKVLQEEGVVQMTKSELKALQKPLQKVSQKARLDTIPIEIDKTIQREGIVQKELQAPKLISTQIQKQVLIEPPITPPRARHPKIPTPTTKILLPFALRSKKKISALEKKYPSYDVMIKSGGKFRKVTKKPLGLTDARNLRDFGIDNSISRQGLLKPRQVKPSPLQYDINPNYSKNVANKFRQYKQKKGKQTQLQRERKIERSKFALDTKSEVKQINIFKLLAKKERERQRQKKNQPVGLQFA